MKVKEKTNVKEKIFNITWFIEVLLLLIYMNFPILAPVWKLSFKVEILVYLLGVAGIILLLIFADGSRGQARQSTILLKGNALLRLFLATLTVQIIVG